MLMVKCKCNNGRGKCNVISGVTSGKTKDIYKGDVSNQFNKALAIYLKSIDVVNHYIQVVVELRIGNIC